MCERGRGVTIGRYSRAVQRTPAARVGVRVSKPVGHLGRKQVECRAVGTLPCMVAHTRPIRAQAIQLAVNVCLAWCTSLRCGTGDGVLRSESAQHECQYEERAVGACHGVCDVCRCASRHTHSAVG